MANLDSLSSSFPAVVQAVRRINKAIQKGVAADTVKELMCPEAQLPPVYPFALTVYQQELAALQQQQGVSSSNAGSCAWVPKQLEGSGNQPRAPSEGTLRCWQRLGRKEGDQACPPENSIIADTLEEKLLYKLT